MSSVFIHHLDTALGETLLEQLSPLFDSVGGTLLRPSQAHSHLNIVSVISTQPEDTPLYHETLLNSDVIIIDLHSEDLNLVQQTLKFLKCQTFEQSKTLVCLSSVRVWGCTDPKRRPFTAEEIAEHEENYPDEDERPSLPELKTDAYSEEEYTRRSAPPQFKPWKNIETLAISIGMNKPNLDVYVFCAGIIYGRGEDSFYSLFKAAWLEEPKNLPIVGSGDNFIPCIHVCDLARSVKYVLQTQPKISYIIAIDNSQDQSQKSIIQSISSGIGTGSTECLNREHLERAEWVDILSLDIKLKPSQVLIPEGQEEQEEEEEVDDDQSEDEEKPKKVKIKLDWICKDGIAANIRLLNEEFNQVRQLVPMKVFLTGPPGSGKSHFSQKLAQFYNVPWIHAADLVEYSKTLTGEFAEKLENRLNELRDEMVEQLEANKADEQEIDPETVHPRIPDNLLAKICQLRLKDNACRNRGYILDGFPRNYDDAYRVFMTKKKSEDDEEEEEDEEEESRKNMELDLTVYPQNVIYLKGADGDILNRVKALPESTLAGTHYNLHDMMRRSKLYREQNNPESGLPTIFSFFTDNSIDVKEIDAFKLECQLQDSIKIFLERFGAPFNYQTHIEQAEQRRIQLLESMRERSEKEKVDSNAKQDALEAEQREKRKAQSLEKLERIHENDKEMLENLAQPVKNYMLENLYDVLSSGLSEVCLRAPEDPIDFLAKFLFEHADKVPHPDPSLYQVIWIK